MSVIETTVDLPRSEGPAVIALGAYLKATVTVAHRGTAFISRTMGDLGDPETIADYEQVVAQMLEETGAVPEIAVHDLHPDFHSSRIAAEWAPRTLAVQHHHAHIAAVAAENEHDGPLLGLALDGFGLGPGDDSWGGELLRVEGADFTRLGHLRRLAQPGGDVAAREPWRMGAAALHVLGRGGEIAGRYADRPGHAVLAQMLDRGVNAPETSSCGRLFDAACGLLGVRPVADFEGQAPMELEALVDRPEILDGGWTIGGDGVLDPSPLMQVLCDFDPADGPRDGANLFHGTLAAALVDWGLGAVERTGIGTVGLSGGCFFNKVLTERVSEGLGAAGVRVLIHRRVSPGDPGLSLGQAWIGTFAA